MLRRATILLALFALPLAARAQNVKDVTVKEIVSAHPDSLAKAIANQNTLSTTELERLLLSPLADSTVRFTAVVLTDVYDSGNASPNNGIPGRVHLFLRDTSAVQNSTVMPGYTVQVVDGNWQTTGWQNYAPGSIVTVTGRVTVFNGTLQIAPTTATLVEDSYATAGFPDAIMQPIPVSITDIMMVGPDDAASNVAVQSKLNLTNWNLYNDEYVKLSGIAIGNSSEWSAGRFNIAFVDNATSLAMEFQDISVRYRNDRVGTDYVTANFNVRDAGNPFVPPAIGARVDIAGFLLYNRNDAFGYFNPNPNLRLVPMTDSDLEVLPGAPPSITGLSRPASLVTGADDLVITVNAEAVDPNTLSKVELYVSVNGGAYSVYPMAVTTGAEYSATVPASMLSDGDFVQYYAKATDSGNSTVDTDTETLRVLSTIDSIADIQTTADGGPGDGALAGLTIDAASNLMDLVVTIQTDADSSNIFSAQDGTDPWSGIFLRSSTELRALDAGTQIRITGAKISEFNGLTQLENLTFETLTCTADCGPYAPVEVTTTMLADPKTAEAHEGMMLRFNNVEITSTNPDAPSGPFGEWAFQTVGTTDALRADDASNNFPSTFAASLTVGAKYSYIQGVLTYSFGNYKLLPQFMSDLGTVVAVGPNELPEGFAVGQSFPNPTAGVTTIPFSLETAGHVTLDVYDTLGRRVARLVDAPRAAGVQSADFDTAALSAGLYVYRLRAGSQTASGTLVVAR